MTTTTNNILLPYLEDTGLDGKKLYTHKEWTERMRHYIKRVHDIDIKPALSGETMPTNNGWTEKEPPLIVSQLQPSPGAGCGRAAVMGRTALWI